MNTSPKPTDRFESPRFLINQTRSNIAEFEELCKKFFDTHKGEQRVDVDLKTGDKTIKVAFEHPFPDRIRHICSSAIVDLRHALDQATCAAYEGVTGKEAPNNLYFPIASNPNDLRGRLNKLFPTELHTVFEEIKPYPTGSAYDGGSDLLMDFNKAAQAKHKIVCRAGGRITSTHFASVKTFNVKQLRVPFEWDVVRNEMIVGITAADGYIDGQFDVLFHVALYDAGPLTGAPAGSTIRDIIELVDQAVSSIADATEKILSVRP